MSKKYVIYCRKSANDSSELESIEKQKQSLFIFAKKKRMSVSCVILDKSPFYKNRPAFKKLLKLIHGGEVNSILTTDVLRLAKHAHDALKLTYLLRDSAVKEIRTLDESYPSNKFAEFIYECASRFSVMCKKCQKKCGWPTKNPSPLDK